MKTKLILAIASILLFVTDMNGRNEPIAVYCSGDSIFYFLGAESQYNHNKIDSKGKPVYSYNVRTTYSRSQEWKNRIPMMAKTIVFEESFREFGFSDLREWFMNYVNLEKLEGLENLRTDYSTQMDRMFLGCVSLRELDLSSFNTSRVFSMSEMFKDCYSLEDIKFGGSFNTKNVNDMSSMFANCKSLKKIDLSNFNPAKVMTMNNMFIFCDSLTDVVLGDNFYAPKLESTSNMFYYCQSLEKLDLSKFKATSYSLRKLYAMFAHCSNLKELDITNLNPYYVFDFSEMFSECSNLEDIYVSEDFDIRVTNSGYNMFKGCRKLRNFDEKYVNEENANYSKSGYLTFKGPYTTFDKTEGILTLKNDSNPYQYDNFYTLSLTPSLYNHNYHYDYRIPNIKKVVIDESFKKSRPTSCSRWFENYENLTEIVGLENLDTSNSTSMYRMFNGCGRLTGLDLSNFDTSKVKDMESIFKGCSSLTSLDLSNFDTSKVTDMESMFDGCSGLASLDLSGFNTSNVTKMVKMFHGCSGLSTLTLGGDFTASKVESMKEMFSGCESFMSLDLSTLNTSQVTDMSSMFSGCSNLFDLYASDKFKTDAVTSSENMFLDCNRLRKFNPAYLDKTKAYFSYADDGYFLFRGPIALYDRNSRTLMFKYSTIGEDLEWDERFYLNEGTEESEDAKTPGWIGRFRIDNVVFHESFKRARPTTCYKWFFQCDYITKITGLENLNTSNMRDMSGLFSGCSELTEIGGFDQFDTSNATDMSEMFSGCSSLTTLSFGEKFNTSNVTNMANMFGGCLRLNSLTFGENFNTSNVTNMASMFNNCGNLNTLTFGDNFNTANVTNMYGMFLDCINLTTLDLSCFNTSKVTDMRDMFYECGNLTSLDLSSFNTSKVTDMGAMFYECGNLTSLDLGSFRTGNVENMAEMFYNCSRLNQIYVSNRFTTDKVTESDLMFSMCRKLSNYDKTKTDKTNANTNPETGYFTEAVPLAAFDSETKTLTFRIGGEQTKETNYKINIGTQDPKWMANTDIKRVVFDESFQIALPTSCYGWFKDLRDLTTIEGLENLNTSNVTNMANMFENCYSLGEIDLSNFDTANVENFSSMFSGCYGLNNLDLSNLNTTKGKELQGMFNQCAGLTSLTFGDNFNTSNVENMSGMFSFCVGLTTLTFGNSYNTINVTDMSDMFKYCTNLKELDLKGFNTAKVTDMRRMFEGCENLKALSIEGKFQTNCEIENAFYNCEGLRMVDLSNAETNYDYKKFLGEINENALIYLPSASPTLGDRSNVIVDGRCADFVINKDVEDNKQQQLIIPRAFTAEKVTINRAFTANNPHTLYLPFEVNATDYGTFYTFDNYDESAGMVYFTDIQERTTTAHTPYMFKPRENLTGIVIAGEVEVKATTEAPELTEDDVLIGVYEKKVFTQEEELEGAYYGWTGKEFRRAGEGASVDACRAYVKLPVGEGGASTQSISATFEEVQSGIDDVEIDDEMKEDVNNSDAPMYNLSGQRVDGNYRGIVIKNGKKMILKGRVPSTL